MSWVRIDDCAPEHRKQLAAGALACWLWTCGLAYCNRQKARDGFIPLSKVKLLYPGLGVKEARRLVEVRLWDELPDGFRIHDYHDYQPTADEADSLRASRAAAGRLGGQRSAEARAKQLLEANSKQQPSKPTKQNPTPSRPDPTDQISPAFGEALTDSEFGSDLPSDPVSASGSSLKRGARVARRKAKLPIPGDWAPKDQHRAKAAKLGLNCDAEAEKFRNNAEGKDVRWVDWDKAFFNWLANGAVFASNGGNGKPPGVSDHERQQAAENARLIDQAKRGEYGDRTRELAAEGRLVGDVLKRFKEAIRTGNLKRRPVGSTRPVEPVSSPRATTDDAVPPGAVSSLLGGIGRPMP